MDKWVELQENGYNELPIETMSEEEFAQLPLRRKLLLEVEDKLDIRLPATRKLTKKAGAQRSIYITNEDLIVLTKALLEKLGAEPRYPMVVLLDEEDRQRITES